MPDAIIHALFDLYPAELGHIGRESDEIHGGRSGAQVLLVDVVGNGTAGSYTGKAYAKIDTSERTQLEFDKHAAARKGQENSIPDVLCPPLHGDKGYSLLLYRPANEAVVGARSLVQVLDEYHKNRHTRESLIIQIEQLVSHALAPWQSVSTLVNRQERQDPLTLVRDLINRGGEDRFSNLEERFEDHFGLSKAPQMLSFVAEAYPPNNVIVLPNPLHYALMPAGFSHLQLARTPMHGDLHTGNIICRLVDNLLVPQMPQMLDMALFEPQGLVFFDLAYLELDILCQCLPVENDDQWLDWLTVLHHLNASDVPPTNNPPGLRPAAAWSLVQPIRQRANALIQEISQHSPTTGEAYRAGWWLAGWASGLVMARRRRLHSSPWRQSAALLSSAWSLAHLLKFWNIRHGSTPQTLKWQGAAGLQADAVSFIPGQRPGKLKNVPALPSYRLERQEDLKKIRELVLTPHATVMGARPVAVQGMGGLGKTVLVASVCHDPDVQRAFPDGIYWLPFGTHPQVTTLQAQLALLIEGRPTTLSDVESLRYLLIRLFSDKRCLLILDDVWDEEHLKGFRSLGDKVRLLVTTRKQAVVSALDAVLYTLPTLDDQQARKLLADASGHSHLQLPDGADTILHECAGLPLALAMIGSALKGKPVDRWDDIGAELKAAHIDEVKTHSWEYTGYNNLWGAIHISVAELDPKIQACYLDFAVFPDDVSIPEKTLITFWRLRGMDDKTVRKTIEKLFEAALLMRDRSAVKLHDLQMDYARLRVEKEQGDISGLHAQLLNAYNPERQPWHKIPHDGYLYQRLGYHLKALGQLEELHQLVTGSPEWRDAKFNACEGDAAYADDVLTLLGKYQDPLSAEDVIRVAQLRAAQQVIRNRTSRYTDTDLKTLTWLGRLGEAFSYARLRPQPEKRFEGLQAIREAIKEKYDSANLAQYVALQHVTHELLEELSSVAHLEDSDSWTVFLRTLVREGLLKEARDAAQAIGDPRNRALALRTVASAHAEKDQTQANALFDEAMQAALGIPLIRNRNKALSDIEAARSHRHIPRPDEETESTEQIQERNGAFQLVIAYIMGQNRDTIGLDEIVEALQAMAATVLQSDPQAKGAPLNLETVNDRDEMLKAIALVQLEKKALEDAEHTALRIVNMDDRASVLSDIAATLAHDGNPDGERVFKQAEESARTIDNTDRRARALNTLVDALAQVQAFNYAEQVAYGIKDEHAHRRVSALITLAASLIEAQSYAHAERIIGRIEDSHKRIHPLIKLAAALAQAKHPDAARIIADAEEFTRKIDHRDKRVEALSALGKALAQAHHPDASRIFADAEALAHTIGQIDRRVSALSALGVALAQVQYPDAARVFANAETLASSIESDKRPSSLQELAVNLAEAGMHAQAEQITSKIEHTDKRASTLRHLAAPLIEAKLYEHVEQIAHQIEQPEIQAHILSNLAVALAPAQPARAKELFKQAEAAVRAIRSEQIEKRIASLRDLALSLARVGFDGVEQLFAQAETLASKIETFNEQNYCLSELAAALAEAKLYKRAEQTIRSITKELQIQSLGELATVVAQAHQFEAAFRMVETQDMPEYLWCVGTWCEALERLEDGLFLRVLRATLSIFAWEQDRWREIDTVLAAHFPQGVALVIGVDNPQEDSSSPSVEARDARSVARFLRYEAGYSHARLLTNHQATRDNIHQGLRWLANQAASNPEAIAVVYYSGQSASLPDEHSYLISYDAQGSNTAMTPIALTDFDEWLANVRAKQTIVFLDCCHTPDASLPFAPVAPDVSAMTASRGRALIASCAQNQQSCVLPNHQNSLFAEVLLEQLRSPGEVELLMLWQKLQTEIKARAADLGCEQTPRLNTVDYDRVVVVKNPGAAE